MDKNRITRPARPDEQARGCEVQRHQGPGREIRRACGEGGRSYLGRATPCPELRTERAATPGIAAGEAAEGIEGGGTPRRVARWRGKWGSALSDARRRRNRNAVALPPRVQAAT